MNGRTRAPGSYLFIVGFGLLIALPSLLVITAVNDGIDAARARAKPPFGCRAPQDEGDLAIITVSLRSGELVAECSYATTRIGKPKTKGG